MNKDEWIFEGVRFLGATFWTDFLADPTFLQSKAMDIVGQALNDYRKIYIEDGTITPELTLSWHLEQKYWLEQKLNESGDFDKTVVLTHTGPSAACQHRSFKLSAISSGFLHDWMTSLKKPICGALVIHILISIRRLVTHV